MDANPIRILVADDHPIVRDGLARLIGDEPGMQLVGDVTNGREAIAAFRKLLPDIALLDLKMPEIDGVGATSAICQEFADAKIIVLTSYSGDIQASRALEAGAAGFLLKIHSAMISSPASVRRSPGALGFQPPSSRR